jgi:hypothetical protein
LTAAYPIAAHLRDARLRAAWLRSRPVFPTVSERRLYCLSNRFDRPFVLGELLAFHDVRQSPSHQAQVRRRQNCRRFLEFSKRSFGEPDI